MHIHIRRTHLLVLGLMLAGAVLAVHLREVYARAAAMPQGPARVAVCDIMTLFREYDKAKALAAAQEERTQAYKAETERRTAALKALNDELGNYVVDSPQYNKIQEDFQRQYIENTVWAETQQAHILETFTSQSMEMYAEIRAGVAAIAAQQNIDMVVQVDPSNIEVNSASDLFGEIDRRKVLYYRNDDTVTIDITEAVLQYINQQAAR